MNVPILNIPGYGNSGPDHWQSIWESRNSHIGRVIQEDWHNPVRSQWVESVERAVAACDQPPILVAHSLGCLSLVHWAAKSQLRIAGAMLVAVPDPDGVRFPKNAIGFAPLPTVKFPFRSIVVMSTDDPYAHPPFVTQFAETCGGDLIDIGAAGHINSTSGLGEWRKGREILQTLTG